MDKETDEIVAEKLKKVNEPGVVVKALPMDSEMVDIEDIDEKLPENLSHAITQKMFKERQPLLRQAKAIILCFNPSLFFSIDVLSSMKHFFPGTTTK